MIKTASEHASSFEPATVSPVRSIRAFSTGRGFQHKEHRSGGAPQLWWVLTSRSWVGLPISVFLIEHKDGLILFDTGLDPALETDPSYISQAIGRFLVKRIFRFEIRPEDKLGNLLSAHGVDAGTIKKAVISHLHFDHIGGIADIPQAELLVSAEEWAQLAGPHPERDWILREHIDIPGAKWTPITFQPTDEPAFDEFDGVYDVMGDGSLILLPTPGHTPGSMSLLVRTSMAPPILFVGDLAYSTQAIMEDRMPGTGDPKLLRKTYAKVRRLKKEFPDLLIIPSHDDNAIAKLENVLNREQADDRH